MQLELLKSKIHRATVTDANLNYEGSITIARDLMDAANILPYEKVGVLDVNNGSRLDTYVIEGKAGSGVICLNGAAARLVQPGDLVIIVTYASIQKKPRTGNRPLAASTGKTKSSKKFRFAVYRSRNTIFFQKKCSQSILRPYKCCILSENKNRGHQCQKTSSCQPLSL